MSLTPDLTRAWNELADFTNLTPLSRRGVSILGTKGRALSMVNADAQRGSLEVVTEDVTAYGIHLPLPPKRTVPRAMTIDIATRLSFRVDLRTSEGVISFACGLGPDDPSQRVVALGDGCGTSKPVHIEPAKHIGGQVTSFDIVGIFEAFKLSIDEAPAGLRERMKVTRNDVHRFSALLQRSSRWASAAIALGGS